MGARGPAAVAVLDELTTGLDPRSRRGVWSIVEDARDAGTTVMLVTHLMEGTGRLCDRHRGGLRCPSPLRIPPGAVLTSEARLFLREPASLFWIVAFPTLQLLLILGAIPAFREPSDDLAGRRVIDLYVPICILLAVATAYERGLLRSPPWRPPWGPFSPDRVPVAVNIGTAGALRPGMSGLHLPGTVWKHDLDSEALARLGMRADDVLQGGRRGTPPSWPRGTPSSPRLPSWSGWRPVHRSSTGRASRRLGVCACRRPAPTGQARERQRRRVRGTG